MAPIAKTKRNSESAEANVMNPRVRLASKGDAPEWLRLVEQCLGSDYPAKEVYDAVWIAREIGSESGHETWVAEVDGKIQASVSFLRPEIVANPIANVGRNLFLPESFQNGSAEALVRKVQQICADRGELGILRVPASMERQQRLLETLGCTCVGYQPLKHMLPVREGILFYLIAERRVLSRRAPPHDLPPQVFPMACQVLQELGLTPPGSVREGIVGLPLYPALHCVDATVDQFREWTGARAVTRSDLKVSSSFHRGFGLMRIPSRAPVEAVIALHEGEVVGGASFIFDQIDQCLRILDAQTAEGFSIRPLLQHLVKLAQSRYNAAYVEVDVAASSGRLLRCLEQLGFGPVSYLPGFLTAQNEQHDLVKFAKSNVPYARELVPFRPSAKHMVDLVETHLSDSMLGQAVIPLLREQTLFAGLGDGDLRKIAFLCQQQMFRGGQAIFVKGDPGHDVFLVLRGQVDLYATESGGPIGSWGNGRMFGEIVLLEDQPHRVSAYAAIPTILLQLGRAAFQDLMFEEPFLGMAVMRNLAAILALQRHD